MPDKKFFNRAQSFTLKQLADITGAEPAKGVDLEYMIEDVAALNMAGPQDLSFLDNVKYKDQFKATKAGACFVNVAMAEIAPASVNLLISETPYKAYALAAQAFYPVQTGPLEVSDHAYIAKSAKIAQGCRIEAGVYIGEGVEIAEGCVIEANTVIRDAVSIGPHTRIGANATISHAIIGAYGNIYTGVRIGQDGFGFAIDPAGHVKVPQLGRVIIGDHVEIGANTTIDRGAGPDTIIGSGTWIDNLVQIGHNVKIGKGCVIIAHVGISGSAVLEDYVVLAGQVGVAGHLTIGTGARIGAQSGVIRDVPPGEEQLGSPALPAKQAMRQIAALKRLINKEKSS